MVNVAASGLVKPVSLGLAAGAGASLLWVAARRWGRDQALEIFDWDRATAVALRAAAAAPAMSSEVRAAREAEYTEILGEITDPLSAYTGTKLKLASTEVRALDRPDWVRINVQNLRELFRPFEDLYRDAASASRFDLPGVTALGRLVVSSEVGILLGYLARRVLGQYDVSLLGARSADPGKLYFVEPNIEAVQLQLGLPHREFRVWLALHEATHAHEFEGHPWVRAYLNATLDAYLSSMADHLRGTHDSLGAFLTRAANGLSTGGTWLEALLTPRQRELVSRLQALMCLLEGYSNHVMSAVGGALLPSFGEIERRIEARSRNRGRAELLFLRLTGLKMKLDQYRLGGAFVDQVKRERGIAFLHQVWNGPENVPTELELREPQRWMRRMEQVAA
jgi:coenzyme F420 biosynthesis associated uncharacterized protein